MFILSAFSDTSRSLAVNFQADGSQLGEEGHFVALGVFCTVKIDLEEIFGPVVARRFEMDEGVF